MDEIINWLQEADEILRNDDLGKDVESVLALLKKHSNVELELYQKEAQLEELKKAAARHNEDSHFAHAHMSRKVQDAMELLEKLQSQAIVFKENLEDSLIYHTYVKDIHDALLWMKEKIALVSVSDFGQSLVEVQSMMKRHQLLEVDVANHNANVKALVEKGEQLIKSNHQQSPEIENLVEELRQLKNQTINHRPKRTIREHYSDLHCLQKFETSEQTIIRTVESQKNGAVFINVTTLESFELCLASCCETSLCNVAIFDESVSFSISNF